MSIVDLKNIYWRLEPGIIALELKRSADRISKSTKKYAGSKLMEELRSDSANVLEVVT